MPRVRAGDLSINYVEHGSGDNVVLAVHGNLGCADWLGLVLPQLPSAIRVIAAEWRGCGDSDKPEPAMMGRMRGSTSSEAMAQRMDMMEMMMRMMMDREADRAPAATMKSMQEMHAKMMAAKTAEERHALMADHMKAMQDGMAMMGRMKGDKGGMTSEAMTRRMDMMEMMIQMMMDREADRAPAAK